MTLEQAMKANVRIVPGQKIRTVGGWRRYDRVLKDGAEIGRIQTQRGGDRLEVVTVSGNLYSLGYNIDWLVGGKDGLYGLNSTAA